MKTTRTFLLNSKKSPVSFILQSRDLPTRRLLHFDEEKKKNRSLRYASNQTSPFQDEQDENSILEPIIFEDGVLTVPDTNPVLYEFLSLHPSNGDVFYEWDPAKDAEEKLNMENLILDAKIEARSLSPDKMASVIRIFTEKNTEKMSLNELKWEVMNIAEYYTEEFMNAINDPELAVDDMAFRAIKDGYVSVRNGGRDVHYNLKDNKKRMFSVPMGESSESALSAWMQSEDGQDFYMFLTKEYES
jgi:hypothetical protein